MSEPLNSLTPEAIATREYWREVAWKDRVVELLESIARNTAKSANSLHRIRRIADKLEASEAKE